jgi:hypothetical protein
MRAKRQQEIIELLEKGHTIIGAARAAGIPHRTVCSWRERDPEFRERSNNAYDDGTDVFRTEARRRSVEGWYEPVYYQGQRVGRVKKFSDTLLMFELKKRDPSYRDHVDVNHSGGIDITKLVAELDKREKGGE